MKIPAVVQVQPGCRVGARGEKATSGRHASSAEAGPGGAPTGPTRASRGAGASLGRGNNSRRDVVRASLAQGPG